MAIIQSSGFLSRFRPQPRLEPPSTITIIETSRASLEAREPTRRAGEDLKTAVMRFVAETLRRMLSVVDTVLTPPPAPPPEDDFMRGWGPDDLESEDKL